MAACHLELMGLHDAAAYRWLARGVLQQAGPLLAGLNVPNKKPGEPLLEWAGVLRHELPGHPVCVHYSLKHQRSSYDPASAFAQFCEEAARIGIERVLLVTGPRGPRLDAVAVLERLRERNQRPAALRIGVAFNACLPTEAERGNERKRLLRKLETGLVEEVWFNCGSDTALLEEGINFVQSAARDLNLAAPFPMFGSVLRPNEAQLTQMREHPWNGVHFGDEYLGSLAGMERLTRAVLTVFGRHRVQPIVESKVWYQRDVEQLQSLLESWGPAASAVPRNPPSKQRDAPTAGARWPAKHGTARGEILGSEVECREDSSLQLGTAPVGARAGAARQREYVEASSFFPPQRRGRRWGGGGGST